MSFASAFSNRMDMTGNWVGAGRLVILDVLTRGRSNRNRINAENGEEINKKISNCDRIHCRVKLHWESAVHSNLSSNFF